MCPGPAFFYMILIPRASLLFLYKYNACFIDLGLDFSGYNTYPGSTPGATLVFFFNPGAVFLGCILIPGAPQV